MPKSKNRLRQCQFCSTQYELSVESSLHKYCSIECRRKYSWNRTGKKYRKTQKGQKTAFTYRLLKKFNITVEEYESLLEKFNNSCAICKRTSPTGRGTFHIDHCHIRNTVRGILCSKCNQGLGLFQDSPQLLREAARYIINAY